MAILQFPRKHTPTHFQEAAHSHTVLMLKTISSLQKEVKELREKDDAHQKEMVDVKSALTFHLGEMQEKGQCIDK